MGGKGVGGGEGRSGGIGIKEEGREVGGALQEGEGLQELRRSCT